MKERLDRISNKLVENLGTKDFESYVEGLFEKYLNKSNIDIQGLYYFVRDDTFHVEFEYGKRFNRMTSNYLVDERGIFWKQKSVDNREEKKFPFKGWEKSMKFILDNEKDGW